MNLIQHSKIQKKSQKKNNNKLSKIHIMKKNALLFLSLLLAGPALTGMQAQQIHASVNAAGGNASGSGGSVSYSVGQVFYTTASGTSASVSEGIQQPFEISIFTGLKDNAAIDLVYAVYPNPTSGKLTLKLNVSSISDIKSMSFQLFDVNGKLIRSDLLKDKETGIEMSDLTPSSYYLRIIANKKIIKTFKIIKN